MSETNFTPGPWRINRIASTNVEDMDGRGVAACGGYSTTVRSTLEENESNALLVASAPELYEALDGLLNSISYNELESYRTDKPASEFVEILDLAEQALKKARGEQ